MVLACLRVADQKSKSRRGPTRHAWKHGRGVPQAASRLSANCPAAQPSRPCTCTEHRVTWYLQKTLLSAHGEIQISHVLVKRRPLGALANLHVEQGYCWMPWWPGRRLERIAPQLNGFSLPARAALLPCIETSIVQTGRNQGRQV